MLSESHSQHFSIANIPFGIASSLTHPAPAAVTRIHDSVIFLDDLRKDGIFSNINGLPQNVFQQSTLNDFAALGRELVTLVRAEIQETFKYGSNYAPPPSAVISISLVEMHLPVQIGDFTDFSCSEDHVVNAGEAVFGKREVPPGFHHYPLGYGGRSSSIVVSGTPVQRPLGQYRSKTEPGKVVFGPCQDLDYELELACIIGKPVQMGDVVTATNADTHIFGVVLLNDWSARDILGLEIVPLGPLNGKSFCTSISPWVVTLDALRPFAVPGPSRASSVAPYLEDPNPNGTYSLQLSADILSGGSATQVCQAKLELANWSFRHIFAHQAIGGCGLDSGDIIATGTLSGKTPDTLGCLLEMTLNGKIPFKLQDGSSRTYLEDGDGVRITGFAGTQNDGVGFGECIGKVTAARNLR